MYGKVLLTALLVGWLAPALVRADGGSMRFSELRDGRRITVFTAPTTLRAGWADVSVLVQEAESGRLLLDVPIVVSAYPANEPWRRLSVPATTDAATNKFLRAAPMTFPEPGRWHVQVLVQESGQAEEIAFDVEVAAGPPPWLDLSLWIGWPLLAIGVFVVHQWLVQRRRRRELGGHLVLQKKPI